jgi:hypothetical protein
MPRAVQIELCQPRAPAFYRAMQDVILYRNGRVEAGGDGAFDGLKNSRERATPRTRKQGLGAPCPHAADMCPAAALIERICCAALRNSAFCTCAATSGNSASTSRPRNLSGSSSKKLTAAASGVCPSLTSSGNFVRLALAGYGSARAQLNGSRRSTCVCCPARATTIDGCSRHRLPLSYRGSYSFVPSRPCNSVDIPRTAPPDNALRPSST